MKLYYYFSVNDRFFTDATIKLAEKYPQMKFYGLAGGRRDFLNSDCFAGITYLSEINISEQNIPDYGYLREKEKQYNFCLAEIINSERNFVYLSKKEKILMAQEIIRRIENDYEKSGFQCVILEGIDDLPSLFLYYFCKEKKIPFFYFVYARMGDAVFLSNRLDTGPVNMDTIFQNNIELYKNDEKVYVNTKTQIEEYIKQKRQPYYVTHSSMLFRLLSFADISGVIKSVRTHYKDKKSYQALAYGNPFFFPLLRFRKVINKRKYTKYFNDKFLTLENLKNKNFFVYPLHFHPEAATLIQGRWLNNQKEIIEMFSKYLPADTILIVKEHKVSIGRRNIHFYKEINNLYNVHFVSHQTDVYNLLEMSQGVITISSSMGLEAIMLNKAVITVGDIHYNILSQVIKARDFSKISEYIKIANNFVCYDEVEYWSFMKTITSNCYRMPGYSPHQYKEEHVDTFVEMIEDIEKAIVINVK